MRRGAARWSTPAPAWVLIWSSARLSAHDGGEYVPKHLWEEWAAKDPIRRLERLMIDQRWTDSANLDQMDSAMKQEIDQAIEWAENSPYPDPSELLEGVYAP